ncbi:hypothetical protein vseg_020093 [Gypsophila vaccaria]
MSYKNIVIFSNLVLLLTLLSLQCMVAPESLAVECNTAFTAMAGCLGFTTGRAAAPTEECCNEVSSVKEKQPVCLCYFIGQAHNGTNKSIKELGIQEVKLIQLPCACHLANSSVDQCPKLLGISPSSPAAAIFIHTNTSSSSSSSSSTSPRREDNSSGFKHGFALLGGLFLVIFVSTFLCSPFV